MGTGRARAGWGQTEGEKQDVAGLNLPGAFLANADGPQWLTLPFAGMLDGGGWSAWRTHLRYGWPIIARHRYNRCIRRAPQGNSAKFGGPGAKNLTVL